jgi:hypothetical protein
MIGHPGCNLLFKRDLGQGIAGRKGDVIAVDAAAGTFAAVTIGAGKAGIHIDLADPATEPAAQVVAIGVDPQVRMDMF